MNLPKDSYMLLSVVNMKLRDNYRSFKEFCDDIDADGVKIIADMEKIGYVYDEKCNQFVFAG